MLIGIFHGKDLERSPFLVTLQASVSNFGKNELLRRVFVRILAADNGTNIAQNKGLAEDPFLRKTTTGCFRSFSFLEPCMYLVSNFTCKATIFKKISSI